MYDDSFGEAGQELLDRGWLWDAGMLTSPSGAVIKNPTPEEVLKLRLGMTIAAVIAERSA